ncbi:MAG TPA: maleylpyruvate isomerase family mycothiol-dependent enzyme [Streptomyces sp.]|jgi:uncharacterized protein (TIGR03085 family)|nr:maleylpyruvate isomerase family mycothiol-dependent enzyme [Streptomyces sp.]
MSFATRFINMRGYGSIGAAERAALTQTMLDLGPDAPTCCEGWTVRDICIHLVLIEWRQDSWFGHQLGDRNERARRYYDGLVQRERERDWPSLVNRLRSGPPLGPLALNALRNRMSLREYVIHHEDIRRANGMAPRTGLDDIQEAMWSKLPGFRRLVKPGTFGIEAVWPGRDRLTLRPGGSAVTLTGEPLELILLVFGRTSVAHVETSGPADSLRDFGSRMLTLPSLPRISSS